MKKRLISMLLAVLLVMSLFSGMSLSAHAETVTYNVTRYRLVQGDYVLRVCQRMGLNFYTCKDAIMKLNNITEKQWRYLAVGREILLPASDADAIAILTGKSVAAPTVVTPTTTTPTSVTPSTTAATVSPTYNDVLAYYLVPYTMGSGENVISACTALGVFNNSYWGVYSNIIKGVNGLKNINAVQAGRTYLFPSTVKPAAGTSCKAVYVHLMNSGETAYSVCNNAGVSYSHAADIIRAINDGKNLNKLKAGETIFYPVDIVVSAGNSGSSAGTGTTPSTDSSGNKLYKLSTNMNTTAGTLTFYVDGKVASTAKAGDKVKVVVTTDGGKAVKQLTVKHLDGKADLLLSGDTFIMPETDVRVDVDIESGYPITIESNYTGKAVATVGGLGVTSASRDSKVKIVSTDPTYEIESVSASYKKMLGGKVDLAITDNGFAMPEAAVEVKVSVRPVTTYDFYVNTIGSGSFFLSVNGGQVSKAAKGTEVKIVTQPLEGFTVTGWSVTKHDDPSVNVSVFNNTFTMPSFDVDVEVTFGEKGNNIVFMPAKGGTAHAEVGGKTVTEAQANDTVTLVAEPLDGYEIDHWTVTRNKDGYKVSVSGDSFVMPVGGVTVTPVFKGKEPITVKVELWVDDVEVTTADMFVGAEVSVGGASAATSYKVSASTSQTPVQDKAGNDPYSGDYISVSYDFPENIAFDSVKILDGSGAAIAEYSNQLKKNDFFELDIKEGSEVVIKVSFTRGKIALPKAAVTGIGSISYVDDATGDSIGSAKAGDIVDILVKPGDNYWFDFSNPGAFDGTFHKYLKVTRKDNGAELPLTEITDGYSFEMPECGVNIQAEFLRAEYVIKMICSDVTDPNNPIDLTGSGLWQIKISDKETIVDNLFSTLNAQLDDIVIASMTDMGKNKYDMVSFNINGWDYTSSVKNYAYNFKIADLRAILPEIVIEAKLKAKNTAEKTIWTNYDASKGNMEFILVQANSPYSVGNQYDLMTPAGPYIKKAYPGDIVGVLVSPSDSKYIPTIRAKGGDATVITPWELIGGTDHNIDVNGDGTVNEKDIVYCFLLPENGATVEAIFNAATYSVKVDLPNSKMPDGTAAKDNLVKAAIDGVTYREIRGTDECFFPDAKAGNVVNVVRTEYAKTQALKIKELIVTGESGQGYNVQAMTDGFCFRMPTENVTITFVLEEDAALKPINFVQTASHLSVTKYKDTAGNLISKALPGETVCIYPDDVTPEKGYVNAGANPQDILKVYEKGYKTNIAEWKTDHWEFVMPKGGYALESNVRLLTYTLQFTVNGGSGKVNISTSGVPIREVASGEKLVVTYGEYVNFSLVSGLGDKSMKLEATGGTVEGNAGYRANAAVEDGATVNVTVTLTA